MASETWAERAAAIFAQPVTVKWKDIARPEQIPPEGDWLVWLFLAGRGAGKTRSAAEWTTEKARTPGTRIALVGRTPADIRDVMIEGESGLVAVAEPGFKPRYEPTKRRLTWPNGSTATAFSAESPSALRGPQFHYAWADESAAWSDARKGDVLDTAWNNLMLGLRLGKNPQCAVTTTPKPNALTRTMMARETTIISRGSTYDNLSNLAPAFRANVIAAYEGTRIGRQELDGELLEDAEGALWTLGMIEDARREHAPDMRRVVVAIDPSGGSGPASDEQGIVVAGLGVDGEFYILADRSCKLTPNGWATRAVDAFREFEADKIVAEKNYGGEMVEATIRQVAPTVPYKAVTATRGKLQRAEPIAALYEQGRVHHIGPMAVLEDQLVTWVPASGDSPDRLDALVWALTELYDAGGQGSAFLNAWKAQAERNGVTIPTTARNWRQAAADLKNGR